MSTAVNSLLSGAELVAPAGDIKKLDIALNYGADAVYLGGKKFSLRAAACGFDYDGLKTAALTAHSRGKKIYIALNIFPYDEDFGEIDEFVDYLQSLHVDGVIVSDLGLIEHIVKTVPSLAVHVSTQANVLNARTAQHYADMGVKRIVLGRELSLDRIKRIRDGLDSHVGLEAFVHGAMCVSYSGRCLLSAYLSGRSANRGECNQACRMRFTPECSSEEFEFVQEDNSTYIFGGGDLNMIEHLSELKAAGVDAFKIEGRVKSEYYVACVVNAYRKAIDVLACGKKLRREIIDELNKAPNRGFNTGFYRGVPHTVTETAPYYEFVGLVVGVNKTGVVVEMRNRFYTSERLQVLSNDDEYLNTEIVVPVMTDKNGGEVTDAKVPLMRVTLPGVTLPMLSVLRRKGK